MLLDVGCHPGKSRHAAKGGVAMTSWLKKLVPAIAAVGLTVAPAISLANTRADSGGTYSTPISSAQTAALPYSAWFAKKDEDSSSIWQWLAGGTAIFATLSIAILDGSGSTRPDNQSNGAN